MIRPWPTVATAALLACALCQAQTIELRNPGFELDENADGRPDNWNFAQHGEGFSVGISDAEAHSGARSVRISGAAEHGDRSAILQVSAPTAVSPGYRLRFFAKGTGEPGAAIFRIRYEAAGQNADQTEHFATQASADEWVENVVEFASSRSALEAGTVRIEVILYQRGTGDLYYDDVSVEPLAEAPRAAIARSEVLQTPRRPLDARQALQNPPDMQWPPQPGAEAYELQLSTDPEFADAQLIGGLRYNCYSHSAVLDRDARWWWRYRYLRGGLPSEWSEATSFTIAPDAVEFPVPPPAELLARVPADHPRVYATRRTLDEFRAPRLHERVAWWEQFQRRCEAHAQAPLPTEPGPEYDFSGREGALTAEQMARMNELRGLGGRATGPMWELGFGYLVSGEERYGRRAADWLVELSGWDVEGTTGYRNHDQVFRDIAWKSACVYDWCHDLMSAQERAQALAMIEARGAILFRDFSEDSRPIYAWPFDSHGWTSMGYLGIIACATAHDSAQADEWLQFVAATYPALYPPWGGEEGGWCQGTAYWKWSLGSFAQFADAFASATGLDLFGKAFFRNDGWFKLAMHPPFCDRHHFGDGNLGSPNTTDRNNLLMLATRFGDPYCKWYADQIPGGPDGGVYGYWWYDYDLPARPPVDVPQSRYLPDIGWVGMHSDMSDPDETMLIFKSSWYGSFNHSHADQNHFVIYGRGEPLLIDSGYYDWYGSDHDRNWTRHTKAHNSILVGGEGQPIFDVTAKGAVTDYFESPVGCYTVGDASAAYAGKLTKFVRHILYLRPDAFAIIDELEAPEPTTFTWCAHALEEMQIDEAARRVTITRGDATLDIAFATPEGLRFTQDNDWDGHPPQGRYAGQPQQWHLFAETTQPTTRMRFVTLMQVREGGQPPTFRSGLPETGGGVRAELGRLLAAVRDGDEPLVIGDSTVDARLAAVHLDDAASQMLAIGCREVSVRRAQAKYFTSTEPVTVTLAWEGTRFVRAEIRSDTTTEVALWVPQGIDSVTLDGRPLTADRCRVDPQTRVVTLSLDAGMHSLTTPEARPAAEGRFGLTIDGVEAQVTQEALPAYTGGVLVRASFDAHPGLHRVSANAPAGAAVTLNGGALSADSQVMWLQESNTLEARMAGPATVPVAIKRIEIEGEPRVVRVLEATPEGLLIEAEAFADSGQGQPTRYSHRAFLSGGVGVGEWIVPGMWLSWEIEPPAPGRYHMAVKGSTHEPYADRLIVLDGEPVGGAWQVFRFEHTGGFGATPEEWREMLVTGADGEPLTLELGPGAHELRMICVANRLNLDWLKLVPAG